MKKLPQISYSCQQDLSSYTSAHVSNVMEDRISSKKQLQIWNGTRSSGPELKYFWNGFNVAPSI